MDLADLLENRAWAVTEPCALLPLLERLPHHVGEETDEDVRLHAMLFMVPDRPDRQLALLDPKCSFASILHLHLHLRKKHAACQALRPDDRSVGRASVGNVLFLVTIYTRLRPGYLIQNDCNEVRKQVLPVKGIRAEEKLKAIVGLCFLGLTIWLGAACNSNNPGVDAATAAAGTAGSAGSSGSSGSNGMGMMPPDAMPIDASIDADTQAKACSDYCSCMVAYCRRVPCVEEHHATMCNFVPGLDMTSCLGLCRMQTTWDLACRMARCSASSAEAECSIAAGGEPSVCH